MDWEETLGELLAEGEELEDPLTKVERVEAEEAVELGLEASKGVGVAVVFLVRSTVLAWEVLVNPPEKAVVLVAPGAQCLVPFQSRTWVIGALTAPLAASVGEKPPAVNTPCLIAIMSACNCLVA